VRRHPAKEAERLLLEKIAAKRPVLDEWRSRQERKRNEAADAEYREANAALMEED
jgi:hypothetical protein